MLRRRGDKEKSSHFRTGLLHRRSFLSEHRGSFFHTIILGTRRGRRCSSKSIGQGKICPESNSNERIVCKRII